MFDTPTRLQYISKILWDVSVTPEEALSVLDNGGRVGELDRTAMYNRILRSFSWHVIMRLIPEEQLGSALSDDVLRRVWPLSLRQRYEYARTLVSG
jgi:hypothetical protein